MGHSDNHIVKLLTFTIIIVSVTVADLSTGGEPELFVDLDSISGGPPTPTKKSATNTALSTTIVKNGSVKVAQGWSQGDNVSTSSQLISAPSHSKNSFSYSVDVLIHLVHLYHDRTSTNDPINEQYYTYSRLGDNVWFNIERVAPFKTVMKWMIQTSQITDRSTKGVSLNNYIQQPDIPCDPETVFDIPETDILSDDKTKRAQLDDKISQWYTKTKNTPPEKMCNRFRGLKCSAMTNKCECDSNDKSVKYVSYTRTSADIPGEYRDGCYSKAWKSCKHLSFDSSIPVEYKAYHANRNNMKQFVMRLATPIPRTPRCEKGTYCVDMILNQHLPICWCSSRMNAECYQMNSSIPLLSQFLDIRKRFHQLIIHERDRESPCVVDPQVQESLEAIKRYLVNVEANFYSILKLMKQLLRKGGRFCDFRKGMVCDPGQKVCTFKTGCGSGRVKDVSTQVCLVNNGYPCPTMDLKCVGGADCKDFGGGRHCHCNPDRFGDTCRYKNPSFFASLLQSRVSGFVGFHFTNLQEIVNNVLTPLEVLMTGGLNTSCTPSLDVFAMRVVKYMGNVRGVSLAQIDTTLAAAQYLVGKDEVICDYRKFLRCTMSQVCEPMIPDVAKYDIASVPGAPGNVKIYLSLNPKAKCSGNGEADNFTNVPAIFQDIVHVQCLPNYECRAGNGGNVDNKYCLCPKGFQGIGCLEASPTGQTGLEKRTSIITSVSNVGPNKRRTRVSRCIRKDGKACFKHV